MKDFYDKVWKRLLICFLSLVSFLLIVDRFIFFFLDLLLNKNVDNELNFLD